MTVKEKALGELFYSVPLVYKNARQFVQLEDQKT